MGDAMASDAIANALGNNGCARGVGLGQNNGKFF